MASPVVVQFVVVVGARRDSANGLPRVENPCLCISINYFPIPIYCTLYTCTSIFFLPPLSPTPLDLHKT